MSSQVYSIVSLFLSSIPCIYVVLVSIPVSSMDFGLLFYPCIQLCLLLFLPGPPRWTLVLIHPLHLSTAFNWSCFCPPGSSLAAVAPCLCVILWIIIHSQEQQMPWPHIGKIRKLTMDFKISRRCLYRYYTVIKSKKPAKPNLSLSQYIES